MILVILAFVAGTLIATVISRLNHAKTLRLLKIDYIDALQKQVHDADRAGYMRGMVDEMARNYEKQQNRASLMPLH